MWGVYMKAGSEAPSLEKEFAAKEEAIAFVEAMAAQWEKQNYDFWRCFTMQYGYHVATQGNRPYQVYIA